MGAQATEVIVVPAMEVIEAQAMEVIEAQATEVIKDPGMVQMVDPHQEDLTMTMTIGLKISIDKLDNTSVIVAPAMEVIVVPAMEVIVVPAMEVIEAQATEVIKDPGMVQMVDLDQKDLTMIMTKGLKILDNKVETTIDKFSFLRLSFQKWSNKRKPN